MKNKEKKMLLAFTVLFITFVLPKMGISMWLVILMDLLLLFFIGDISEAADLLIDPTQEKVDDYFASIAAVVKKKNLDILDINAMIRRDLFCLNQKQINRIKNFIAYDYDQEKSKNRVLLDAFKMQLELF